MARTDHEKQIQALKPNFNLLKDKLEIVNSAASQGDNNLPEPSSDQFDQPQVKIKAHMLEAMNNLILEARRKQDILTTKREQQELSSSLTDIENVKNTVSNILMRERERAKMTMLPLRRNERKKLRELASFKVRNDLTRDAVIPESSLLPFAFIAAIIVVESALNSWLFFKGNALGLVGALIQAMAVSCLNITSAASVGYFITRYKNHNETLNRYLAYGMTSLYLIFNFSFNLMVGHYRELMEGPMPEQAMQQAFGHFVAAPFNLSNMNSIMLIAIGVLLSLLGLYKGYRSISDVYPGYGRRLKHYNNALNQYEGFKLSFQETIITLFEEQRNFINEITEATNNKYATYKTLLEDAKGVDKAAGIVAGQIDATYNHLLKEYRKINKDVRSIATPAYFEKDDTLTTEATYIPVDFSKDDKQLQKMEEKREVIRAKAEEAMQTTYSNEKEALKRLNSVLRDLEQEVDKELDEIQKNENLVKRREAALVAGNNGDSEQVNTGDESGYDMQYANEDSGNEGAEAAQRPGV